MHTFDLTLRILRDLSDSPQTPLTSIIPASYPNDWVTLPIAGEVAGDRR